MIKKVLDISSCHNKVYVLLAQYSDLFTLGSSSDRQDIINLDNIPVYNAARGGKITYHGPGQRVIYPIVHLSYFNKDIRCYVNFLAKTLIETLRFWKVEAFLCNKNIGIWIHYRNEIRKISSIGIRVSKFVAHYGMSVNINTDLKKFNLIKACGIEKNHQISLRDIGLKISIKEFDMIFEQKFRSNFPILKTI